MTWVLVVEDDDDNRDLVLEILDEAGYHARGADGGASALALLQGDDTPCLVLTDLVMDDMDGKALQNEARRILRDRVPPFIFVTGANPSNLEDISGTFLTKPIEIDQLLAVVAAQCGPPGRRLPEAAAVG
jgi:CheY-like chemotaxis protein